MWTINYYTNLWKKIQINHLYKTCHTNFVVYQVMQQLCGSKYLQGRLMTLKTEAH